VIIADVIGLALIVAAGLALVAWKVIEDAAEAEWRQVDRLWRRSGDIVAALSAEVRRRADAGRVP
jgi:hypothetical protein